VEKASKEGGGVEGGGTIRGQRGFFFGMGWEWDYVDDGDLAVEKLCVFEIRACLKGKYGGVIWEWCQPVILNEVKEKKGLSRSARKLSY